MKNTVKTHYCKLMHFFGQYSKGIIFSFLKFFKRLHWYYFTLILTIEKYQKHCVNEKQLLYLLDKPSYLSS